MSGGITSYIREIKELFPEDSGTTARCFGAALYYEDQGNHEKAAEFLAKAIAAEESGS